MSTIHRKKKKSRRRGAYAEDATHDEELGQKKVVGTQTRARSTEIVEVARQRALAEERESARNHSQRRVLSAFRAKQTGGERTKGK